MIQSRCHFRKLVLLRMIECIGKEEVYNVNLLDAVRFVHKAWERITEKTIQNLFRQAFQVIRVVHNFYEAHQKMCN